ncbi:MAG: carboxypeptidase M32, partial [Coxiellaceae bacterium]|nr:carboxypeptidase M32 [Coxiellaceae bacterium]
IMHETLLSCGDVIDDAVAPDNSWDQRNVEIIRRLYLRAKSLPASLVGAMTTARMICEQQWRQCRAENNWQDFMPYLTRVFDYTKEAAMIQGDILGMDPYDALIDEYSPGVTSTIVDPLFQQLRQELPSLIQDIVAKQRQDHVIMPNAHFPIAQQNQLGLALMQALGFDFNHGRLDVSHHPFCGGVPDDTRITTRYDERDFVQSVMAVVHETGHARYEQHLPEQWRNQPVGRALGMSIHESQSIMTEMYVCRSSEFMIFLAPLVQRYFGQHEAYSAENLYKLYTRVKPGY